MKELLKLVRWPNLIIISLTMIMMRYCVIQTLIEKYNGDVIMASSVVAKITLQFPLYQFIILIAATLFLTGAGYIINDYFDIKTDLINRGNVIVGTKVPRRQAIKWHNNLNILGVTSGFYVSLKTGDFLMGILFLLVSGLLYFYSANYKRHFLIGNILVAVLTAMVPVLVVFFDAHSINSYYGLKKASLPVIHQIFYWVGGFAFFALLTTLIREIIKDIEDYEGDFEYGRKTLPIVVGIKATRRIVIWLLVITILLLFGAWIFFIGDFLSIGYLSIAVIFPLFYVIYLTINSETRNQFHTASRLMKIIMLTGILFSVLFKFII